MLVGVRFWVKTVGFEKWCLFEVSRRGSSGIVGSRAGLPRGLLQGHRAVRVGGALGVRGTCSCLHSAAGHTTLGEDTQKRAGGGERYINR